MRNRELINRLIDIPMYADIVQESDGSVRANWDGGLKWRLILSKPKTEEEKYVPQVGDKVVMDDKRYVITGYQGPSSYYYRENTVPFLCSSLEEMRERGLRRAE